MDIPQPTSFIHRRVNWWLAAGVILVVAVSAAFAISASALSAFYFGGRIIAYQPVCTSSNGLVCDNCSFCSKWGSACMTMQEIQFVPTGGTTFFICPIQGYTFIGGLPHVGATILGHGLNDAFLFQVGVGK